MTSRDEDIDRLQTKVRTVRTPEGAELYDEPIGAPIRPHGPQAALPRPRRARSGLIHPGHDPGADLPPRPPERPRTPRAPKPVVPTTTAAVQKVDRRHTQGQTISNFIHPDTGHVMGKTETGDTFEQLFKAKMQASLEDKFGCCLKLITGAGEGTNRTTPLDFQIGDRGGEVKSLNARAKNQKTAIKKAEVERKVNACTAAKLKALLVVQVIDQDNGVVSVYGYPAFASKAVSSMTLLGEYKFGDKDFQSAQEASGHWDKRHARLAAQKAKKAAEGKSALGQTYDPPDEEGGVIEPGDSVVELRPIQGRPVPFIWTEGEGQEGADGEGGPPPPETKEAIFREELHPRGPGGRFTHGAGTAVRRMLSAQDVLAMTGLDGWQTMRRPSNAPGIEVDDENALVKYQGRVVYMPNGKWFWSIRGHALADNRQYHHDGRVDGPEEAIKQVEQHIRSETGRERARNVHPSRSVDNDMAQAAETLRRQEALVTHNIWTSERLEGLASAEFPWRSFNTGGHGLGLRIERRTPDTHLMATIVRADDIGHGWRYRVFGEGSDDWLQEHGIEPDPERAAAKAESLLRAMDSNERQRRQSADANLTRIVASPDPVPVATPGTDTPTEWTLDRLIAEGREGFEWRSLGDDGIQVSRRTDASAFAAQVVRRPAGDWGYRARGLAVDGTGGWMEKEGSTWDPVLAMHLAEGFIVTSDDDLARTREAAPPPLPDDGSFMHFVKQDTEWGYTQYVLHPEAERRLKAVYEGTFGDLAIRVDVVQPQGTNDLYVEGAILDDNASRVGDWNVTVKRRTDDKGGTYLAADHGLLQLQEHVQAAGLATEWRMQLMQEYLRLSVREVRNHADISVGGYSWAKAGFGWDPDQGRPWNVIDRLDRAFGIDPAEHYDYATQGYVTRTATPRLENFAPETREKALDIHTRMRNLDVTDPNYPTPQDVAALGLADKYERERSENPLGGERSYRDDTTVLTSWPGKDILLGSDWHALARLG